MGNIPLLFTVGLVGSWEVSSVSIVTSETDTSLHKLETVILSYPVQHLPSHHKTPLTNSLCIVPVCGDSCHDALIREYFIGWLLAHTHGQVAHEQTETRYSSVNYD